MSNLDKQFEQDMIADSQEYTRLTKTSPSRYLQMIAQHGAVETARRLASDPQFHEGFTRAWEHNCLYLTAEYLMLFGRNGAYKSLFGEETLRSAEKKLKQVGVISALR